MKIIITNLLFGAILWVYWRYVGGNKVLFVPGMFLAFVSFSCGIMVGASARDKSQKRNRAYRAFNEKNFETIV